MKNLKKIASVICAAAMSASMLALTPSAAGDWKTAYSDLLKKSIGSEEPEYETFSLFDIDSDGTPELIASQGDWHMAQCDVYTYSGGKLTKIDTVGSYGACGFSPANNYIISGYMGMGYYSEVFLKMSGNSFEEVKRFDDDSGNYENISDCTFEIDGKKVTYKKYTDEMAKWNQKGSVSLGQTFKIDKNSIKYAVTGVSDYKTAYSQFLSGGLSELMTDEKISFSLADITGDNIPELFVRSYGLTDIYTFTDGRIQIICDDYTDVFAEKKSYKKAVSADKKYIMLAATAPQEKTYAYAFYKIKNGCLERIAYMSTEIDYYTGKRTYSLNGRTVSKSAFTKAVSKYKGIGKKDISKEYLMTPENIQKYLK